MSIKWEEPKPLDNGRGKGKWFDILGELRKHPNRWANVGEHNDAMRANIRRGKVGGATEGEFEVTMRDIDPNTRRGTMYVRYVGADS